MSESNVIQKQDTSLHRSILAHGCCWRWELTQHLLPEGICIYGYLLSMLVATPASATSMVFGRNSVIATVASANSLVFGRSSAVAGVLILRLRGGSLAATKLLIPQSPSFHHVHLCPSRKHNRLNCFVENFERGPLDSPLQYPFEEPLYCGTRQILK